MDWTTPARQINDRRRGFTPWPGAYTTFRGQPLSLLRTEALEDKSLLPSVIRVDGKSLLVGTGDGALAISEVQPGGKKRMSVEAYINGYQPRNGERMGDEQ